MREVEKLGYSYREAAFATGLGQTTLYGLVAAKVIRVAHIGDRAILNAADVRKVVEEGYRPSTRTPPRPPRGPRRRPGDGEPPAAA